MSKRKNNNKNNNNNKKNSNKINFPFNNELLLAKAEIKQMIDDMPDDIFIDFCVFLNSFFNDFDEGWLDAQWALDEGWEDEAEAFYNHDKNLTDPLTLFDENDLPF